MYINSELQHIPVSYSLPKVSEREEMMWETWQYVQKLYKEVYLKKSI